MEQKQKFRHEHPVAILIDKLTDAGFGGDDVISAADVVDVVNDHYEAAANWVDYNIPQEPTPPETGDHEGGAAL